tara:strand:+ start:410 stop:1147 length:738 start_codon:yes stop_codon:yes gene_type:complete
MTGIIIIARLGSSRLPQKHLYKINSKPLIEHFIERITANFSLKENKVIIATTKKKIDKKFDYLKEKYKIQIFNGNETNIPLRLYDCMKQMKINKSIILEGDDLLFSISAVKKIILRLRNGANYISSKGLPIGMNSYGMTNELLKSYYNSFSNKAVIETGWLRIFKELPYVIDFDIQKNTQLRFTIDYEEDLLFFEKIFLHFKNDIKHKDHLEIINYVSKNKLFETNAFINKKYFINFQANKENER